jgi:glycosyltransferase involved in cell wall biosynthesis
VGVESKVAENSFPEIAVLLATHNPTSVIKEQIDSIYSQELVKVKVYWGDDRSNEETKTYIRSLLAGKNYVEISDTGIGATKNFLHLLRFPTEEYIAFSDQDDVWLPRKLAQHIQLLKNSSDLPALSHSNSLLLINGMKQTKTSVCSGHSFYELSWQNCVQGCTKVINSKLQKLLNIMPQNYVLAHDWWIAQVASLHGLIFVNENKDTLYRIHPGNAIGNPGIMQRVKLSIKRTGGIQSKQALEILEFNDNLHLLHYDEMELLKTYWEKINSGSILDRLIIAISDRKGRSAFIEDLWRRISLIIHSP